MMSVRTKIMTYNNEDGGKDDESFICSTYIWFLLTINHPKALYNHVNILRDSTGAPYRQQAACQSERWWASPDGLVAGRKPPVVLEMVV